MLFPGIRVLIVEDEMLIVMALEDMLTDLGAIPVAQACSVSEGLALVEKGGFDVAILDINLRGTKVFPVAEAMEASGKPYIFASGYGESEILPEFAGHPILVKPYQADRLVSALKTVLCAHLA